MHKNKFILNNRSKALWKLRKVHFESITHLFKTSYLPGALISSNFHLGISSNFQCWHQFEFSLMLALVRIYLEVGISSNSFRSWHQFEFIQKLALVRIYLEVGISSNSFRSWHQFEFIQKLALVRIYLEVGISSNLFRSWH